MSYTKWLNELEVGDPVFIERSWRNEPLLKSYVDELQFGGGIKVVHFNYKEIVFFGGVYEGNGGKASCALIMPTDKLEDEFMLRTMRNRLSAVNWTNVSDKAVHRVWNVIHEKV